MFPFMSDDPEHAHNQCRFTPWRCNVELLGMLTFFSLPHFKLIQHISIASFMVNFFNFCSDSPLFGYLYLFYGRVLLSFSNGPFMLLYQYGNFGYPFVHAWQELACHRSGNSIAIPVQSHFIMWLVGNNKTMLFPWFTSLSHTSISTNILISLFFLKIK